MRPLRFGLFLPQAGLSFEEVCARAAMAERVGFDSVWLVDHFWARGLADLDHLECWTLMSALAARTQRLRIGTLVGCSSYRNPALVAKMAASLDRISEGRFVLGMGAGWMDEEYRAYGYEFPPIGTRLDQLDEALHVIRRMLSDEVSSYEGRYFRTHQAVNRPRPVQVPHPPILVGGAGERRMLPIVAEHADIWNCPNNYARELPRKLDILRRACDARGRDPGSIEVSEQCVAVIGRDAREFETKLALARATTGTVFDLETAGLLGTAGQIIEAIHRRAHLGVTFFTVMVGDLNSIESIELFGREVIAALPRAAQP